MKPAPFEYNLAADAGDAVALLSRYDGEAKVLAGGQSLLPLLSLRLAEPVALVDIGAISELGYHRCEPDTLVVGATCTHRDIERDPRVAQRVPVIAEAVSSIGHVSIRNRGTVAGSIAHADPAAEWPLLAVLLDAQMVAQGPGGTRTAPADEFFLGFLSTGLEADELLAEVRFPLPPLSAGSAFVELARRQGDFSLVGVGVALDVGPDGLVSYARIAVNGVDNKPVRSLDAEAVLVGERPGEDVFDEAGRVVAAQLEPPSDLHASAQYRRSLAHVLVRRALTLAAGRAGEEAVHGA